MTDWIPDDELLYRRIAPAHLAGDRITEEGALPDRTNDVDGLSFSRAVFDTPDALVERSFRKNGAVFAITAGRVRALGLTVVPDPTADNPGHCLIPELGSTQRREPRTLFLCNALARELEKQMVRPSGPAAG
jgi:hypothetical protein